MTKDPNIQYNGEMDGEPIMRRKTSGDLISEAFSQMAVDTLNRLYKPDVKLQEHKKK